MRKYLNPEMQTANVEVLESQADGGIPNKRFSFKKLRKWPNAKVQDGDHLDLPLLKTLPSTNYGKAICKSSQYPWDNSSLSSFILSRRETQTRREHAHTDQILIARSEPHRGKRERGARILSCD